MCIPLTQTVVPHLPMYVCHSVKILYVPTHQNLTDLAKGNEWMNNIPKGDSLL